MQGGVSRRALSWLGRLAAHRTQLRQGAASLHQLTNADCAPIAYVSDRPPMRFLHASSPHFRPLDLDSRSLAKFGGAQLIAGMLSVPDLEGKVKSGEIDTVIVGMTDMYGRMVGKRYDAEFFLEFAVKEGTHACSYLLATDMDMETVPGYKIANWATGYGDDHLQPDLRTLRTCSWLEKTALVLCDVQTESHELAGHAPRSILQRQVAEAKKLDCQPMAATEVEYYLYQDSFEDAYKKRYAGLSAVGWHREDYHILQGTREEFFNGTARRHLAASGVPVENSKGEFGLGQHELNVKYSDALDMADRHVVYKQCLKEVAESMGVSVTFMAKPHVDQAGSSCHVHMSLWRDGKNAFVGDKQLGPISNCSDEFKWFLGGWMKYTPELMVFYAPTVNSYKRFQSGSWAPTKIAWSKDNRTAPFRIVGSGKGLRIECRLPGADCNPYLGLAAGLASGLEGIRSKIEPPPPITGDVYTSESELLSIPQTLREAIDVFAKSEFAGKMLTETVREHYAHFYRTEQRAFDRAVTDWEKIRYFEQI